ncbi:hypothetical protein HK102_003017, partial [Quaeritorhiza haematococci]
MAGLALSYQYRRLITRRFKSKAPLLLLFLVIYLSVVSWGNEGRERNVHRRSLKPRSQQQKRSEPLPVLDDVGEEGGVGLNFSGPTPPREATVVGKREVGPQRPRSRDDVVSKNQLQNEPPDSRAGELKERVDAMRDARQPPLPIPDSTNPQQPPTSFSPRDPNPPPNPPPNTSPLNPNPIFQEQTQQQPSPSVHRLKPQTPPKLTERHTSTVTSNEEEEEESEDDEDGDSISDRHEIRVMQRASHMRDQEQHLSQHDPHGREDPSPAEGVGHGGAGVVHDDGIAELRDRRGVGKKDKDKENGLGGGPHMHRHREDPRSDEVYRAVGRGVHSHLEEREEHAYEYNLKRRSKSGINPDLAPPSPFEGALPDVEFDAGTADGVGGVDGAGNGGVDRGESVLKCRAGSCHIRNLYYIDNEFHVYLPGRRSLGGERVKKASQVIYLHSGVAHDAPNITLNVHFTDPPPVRALPPPPSSPSNPAMKLEGKKQRQQTPLGIQLPNGDTLVDAKKTPNPPKDGTELTPISLTKIPHLTSIFAIPIHTTLMGIMSTAVGAWFTMQELDLIDVWKTEKGKDRDGDGDADSFVHAFEKRETVDAILGMQQRIVLIEINERGELVLPGKDEVGGKSPTHKHGGVGGKTGTGNVERFHRWHEFFHFMAPAHPITYLSDGDILGSDTNSQQQHEPQGASAPSNGRSQNLLIENAVLGISRAFRIHDFWVEDMEWGN